MTSSATFILPAQGVQSGTVTWIDVPGSAIGRSDAVDFIMSSEPVAISVSFGAGAEERAFRDGEFLYPYLDSTRFGMTFALRRRGGWPKSPRVYVDEAAPEAPVVTTLWSTLYEVDMTAQGSLSISNATSTTAVIDGKTWTFESALTVARELTSWGLRIAWGGGSNWPNGSMTHMALSQLAGYDATKQHAVLARITGDSFTGSTLAVGAGLWAPSSRANSHTVMEFSNDTLHGKWGITAGTTDAIIDHEVGSSIANLSAAWVLGAARTDSTRGVTYWAPWTGAFPSVEQCRVLCGTNDRGYTSNTGWAAGFFSSGGNSHANARLTHLKVLQR
jgi:hypothetical protein